MSNLVLAALVGAAVGYAMGLRRQSPPTPVEVRLHVEGKQIAESLRAWNRRNGRGDPGLSIA